MMRNVDLVRRVIAATAIGAMTAAPAAPAERPWVEVRSPHFTVVSNAGEKEGRDVAWQFEQAHSVFRKLWPWARQDGGRPFVVIVARDRRTLGDLAPEFFGGRDGERTPAVFASSRDVDFVALRTDLDASSDVRVNPYSTAFEGYARNVLVRHFPARMPVWYAEGLREVFGNTLVREKDVHVGRVIPWHLTALTGQAPPSVRLEGRDDFRMPAPTTTALLPLTRLVTIGTGDPEYTGEGDRRLFAAQSWALVHFLMFGEGGIHRSKFNRIADLLRQGRPGEEATRTALGDITLMEPAYRRYVRERQYQFLRIDADVRVAREHWETRTLPEGELEAVKAAFRVALGHPVAPPPAGAAAALAPRAAPPEASAPATAPDLVAACGDGDVAACGRLAPLLESACIGGDAAMCMPLAFLYKHGRGVARDLARARALYSRACEAGEARACDSMRQIPEPAQ